MNTWTEDELKRINAADELELATLRLDGTLRNPVTIWAVCTGGELYIRAVKGTNGLWYRHATESHKGQIRAGGITKDVTFAKVDDEEVNKEIDQAYQSKYNKYSSQIVNSVLTPQTRAATLKVTPR